MDDDQDLDTIPSPVPTPVAGETHTPESRIVQPQERMILVPVRNMVLFPGVVFDSLGGAS